MLTTYSIFVSQLHMPIGGIWLEDQEQLWLTVFQLCYEGGQRGLGKE